MTDGLDEATLREAAERAVFDAWAVRECSEPTSDTSWWHIHASGPTHSKWAADAAIDAILPLLRARLGDQDEQAGKIGRCQVATIGGHLCARPFAHTGPHDVIPRRPVGLGDQPAQAEKLEIETRIVKFSPECPRWAHPELPCPDGCIAERRRVGPWVRVDQSRCNPVPGLLQRSGDVVSRVDQEDSQ